mmetsp:Transcript_402/g.911  ORF Transcript_402/g.911 Transcript_402/m.911 type:complete len:264 (-) Transcript_402:591-1382(-)
MTVATHVYACSFGAIGRLHQIVGRALSLVERTIPKLGPFRANLTELLLPPFLLLDLGLRLFLLRLLIVLTGLHLRFLNDDGTSSSLFVLLDGRSIRLLLLQLSPDGPVRRGLLHALDSLQPGFSDGAEEWKRCGRGRFCLLRLLGDNGNNRLVFGNFFFIGSRIDLLLLVRLLRLLDGDRIRHLLGNGNRRGHARRIDVWLWLFYSLLTSLLDVGLWLFRGLLFLLHVACLLLSLVLGNLPVFLLHLLLLLLARLLLLLDLSS